MDAKTILNPKGWLIGVGIVNILFSIMNYMMGGDVATTALEAEYGALSDRELAVATGYEEGWGIFGHSLRRLGHCLGRSPLWF